MGKLFAELKRRNVVRVGIAYILLAWVALQVGDVLFDLFEAPPWVGKSVAALLLLGFPFACLFAWAFELTPDGIRKTSAVDRSASITPSTGRKLDRVIIVVLVIALGYFIWERQAGVEPTTTTAMLDKSIAVLPFVNMSSDAEQEWFADGLTEEILNALARTPDLLVASRTSSFQYKDRNEDISVIAAALGVAHILEGSVRRGGDRLRVTAQLIRASDGFHLWSETFDRSPEDVIAIQENVAFEIANALETAMDPEALQKMVSAGTASVAAYEAYLEGLALETRTGETGDIEDWEIAYARFERAVEIDPGFTLAHYHRATYWAAKLNITNVGSEIVGVTRAEILANYLAAIDAAIATEDDEVQALRYRGDKAFNELRFGDARRAWERLIEVYPHDTEVLTNLFNVISATRDLDAARAHVHRVAEVAHDDPLSLNSLINAVLFAGLVDDAVTLARDVVARYPQHAFLLYQAHRTLLWGGQLDEARQLAAELQRSQFPEVNIRLVQLRQACAEGRLEDAQTAFEQVLAIPRQDPSVAFIAYQVTSRPAEAHQLLVDANLDLTALAGFLAYPYFDHTLFPDLARRLADQSIDRQFISGPPYRCGTAD